MADNHVPEKLNTPLHDIKIGTLIRSEPSHEDNIKAIIDHGFESFGLLFNPDISDINLNHTAAECIEAVKDKAVISHISCFGNPLKDDEQAKMTVQTFTKLIDAAEMFGCNLVTGFTGRIPDTPIDQCIDRFKQIWTPIVEKAQKKNVRIAFENCDMHGDWFRGDHNIAHNPTAWEMIFDAVPADNIGLQWEPCHQMVSLIDPIPQLKKWVHKIFNVHGKDASIHWDVIREFGIDGPKQFAFHRTPGFGDSNWTDIISILRMAGFKGSIDIEGWHDPVYRGPLEITGQVHALKYLKNCRIENYIPE